MTTRIDNHPLTASNPGTTWVSQYQNVPIVQPFCTLLQQETELAVATTASSKIQNAKLESDHHQHQTSPHYFFHIYSWIAFLSHNQQFQVSK